MLFKRGTRARTRKYSNNYFNHLAPCKRSQVTIFIIIAVLIIAIVGLFFVFRGGIEKKEVYSSEIAPIQDFVQECLDDSLEDAVFTIGEGGGYEDPLKVSSTFVFNTPYYLRNNKSLMPSKEKIQEEISKSVEKNLIFCLGDFALFPEYEITKGKMTSVSKIQENNVLIEINYPLTIKKIDSESKTKIKNFNSEVSIRLGIVYDSIAEFIEENKQTEGVCISCLVNAVGKNNLKSTFSDYDNKTIIFIVEDPNSKINNREFVYVFANEY